jgi:uncharacterized membrane protein YkvA (DUF1232 family)
MDPISCYTLKESKSKIEQCHPFGNIKQHAKQLKVEIFAFLCLSRPRLSLCTYLCCCVVGYAFSPIDFIPDPIPILGYLDDLLIIPLGVWLALKMIPPEVMADARIKAGERLQQKQPVNWVAGAIILAVWLLLAVFVIRFTVELVKR